MPERADDVRGGRAGLRGRDLARRDGAERHAAGDRQSPQRGDREDRATADVRADWAKQGATAMTMPPDEFARYVADDIAKWEKVVKVSGAKADR